MSGNLTNNFSVKEFACHCCGEVKLHTMLLTLIEQVRDVFNRPIMIHCCYRCSKHNKEVGSNDNSLHLLGWAVDFHVDGLAIEDVAKKMKQYHDNTKFGGLGIYYTKGFIHLDLGRFRYWEG